MGNSLKSRWHQEDESGTDVSEDESFSEGETEVSVCDGSGSESGNSNTDISDSDVDNDVGNNVGNDGKDDGEDEGEDDGEDDGEDEREDEGYRHELGYLTYRRIGQTDVQANDIISRHGTISTTPHREDIDSKSPADSSSSAAVSSYESECQSSDTTSTIDKYAVSTIDDSGTIDNVLACKNRFFDSEESLEGFLLKSEAAQLLEDENKMCLMLSNKTHRAIYGKEGPTNKPDNVVDGEVPVVNLSVAASSPNAEYPTKQTSHVLKCSPTKYGDFVCVTDTHIKETQVVMQTPFCPSLFVLITDRGRAVARLMTNKRLLKHIGLYDAEEQSSADQKPRTRWFQIVTLLDDSAKNVDIDSAHLIKPHEVSLSQRKLTRNWSLTNCNDLGELPPIRDNDSTDEIDDGDEHSFGCNGGSNDTRSGTADKANVLFSNKRATRYNLSPADGASHELRSNIADAKEIEEVWRLLNTPAKTKNPESIKYKDRDVCGERRCDDELYKVMSSMAYRQIIELVTERIALPLAKVGFEIERLRSMLQPAVCISSATNRNNSDSEEKDETLICRRRRREDVQLDSRESTSSLQRRRSKLRCTGMIANASSGGVDNCYNNETSTQVKVEYLEQSGTVCNLLQCEHSSCVTSTPSRACNRVLELRTRTILGNNTDVAKKEITPEVATSAVLELTLIPTDDIPVAKLEGTLSVTKHVDYCNGQANAIDKSLSISTPMSNSNDHCNNRNVRRDNTVTDLPYRRTHRRRVVGARCSERKNKTSG